MTIQTFKGVQNQELVLKADYDKLAAECLPYKLFFDTALEIAFEGCDFYGDDIQGAAFSLGLVKSEVYESEKHSNLVNDPSIFDDGDSLYTRVETPATDAAIAEFKAQGVDEFATDIGNLHNQMRKGGHQQQAIKHIVFRAIKFAANLRAGG